MKKDIEIPVVEKVYVAVVQELNKEHNEKDWVAYIINDQEIDLEMKLRGRAEGTLKIKNNLVDIMIQ